MAPMAFEIVQFSRGPTRTTFTRQVVKTVRDGAHAAAIVEQYGRTTIPFRTYDGLPATPPNSLEGLDVIAGAGINGYPNGRAQTYYEILQLKPQVDDLLAAIPHEPDSWRTYDFYAAPRPLEKLLALLDGVKEVRLAVGTKILHRKRPDLIPILDSVVQTLDYTHAATVLYDPPGYCTMDWLRHLRDDVLLNEEILAFARSAVLEGGGPSLSLLRVYDILRWCAVSRTHFF